MQHIGHFTPGKSSGKGGKWALWPVWTDMKRKSPASFGLLTTDRRAHSLPLYRLCCPGPKTSIYSRKIFQKFYYNFEGNISKTFLEVLYVACVDYMCELPNHLEITSRDGNVFLSAILVVKCNISGTINKDKIWFWVPGVQITLKVSLIYYCI